MINISQLGFRPPNISPGSNPNPPPQITKNTSISPSQTFASANDLHSVGQSQAIIILNNKFAELTKFKIALEKLMQDNNCLSFDLFRDYLDFETLKLSQAVKELSSNNLDLTIGALEELIICSLAIKDILTTGQTEITTIYNQNSNLVKSKIEEIEKTLSEEVKAGLITEVEIIDAWEEIESQKINDDIKSRHPEWFSKENTQTRETLEEIQTETARLQEILQSKSGLQLILEAQQQTDDPKFSFLFLNFAEIKTHQDWRKELENLAKTQDQYRAEALRLEKIGKMLGTIPPSLQRRYPKIQKLSLDYQSRKTSLFQSLKKTTSDSKSIKNQMGKTYRLFHDITQRYDTNLSELKKSQNQNELLIYSIERKRAIVQFLNFLLNEYFSLFCQENNVASSLPYLSLTQAEDPEI